VGFVALAQVVDLAFSGNAAARVLPGLSGIVPVEPNSERAFGDVGGLLLRELDPDPCSDDLGAFKELRRLIAEKVQKACTSALSSTALLCIPFPTGFRMVWETTRGNWDET
jgi:hypothetical protein